VMEVLKAASDGDGRQPEFLSTHPYAETRMDAIDVLLATEYAFTQDNSNYRDYQGRFERIIRPHLDPPEAR
jgi:predicted Zn-dependent protease